MATEGKEQKGRKNLKKKGKKFRGKNNESLPTEVVNDERFKDVLSDPKFRPIPKSESKVAIDKRFGKMFTDKRFKIKATMDRRGRPVSSTSNEDLKRFYHIDESEDEDDTDDEQEQDAANEKGALVTDSDAKKIRKEDRKKKKKKGKGSSSEESEDELFDFARGEGNIESSSEDSPDTEDEVDESGRWAGDLEEAEVQWDELDKDAPRSEDISRRLALCNMDWQNIKAVDIFVIMTSFAPQGGTVTKVSIYPTEFGKERLKEEMMRGPKFKGKSDVALRNYEFDRLKYYFAVVECDSEKTANGIYESCDGTEYMTSGNKIDLRFIPDDMDFDESEITESCDTAPQNYEPVDFINSAMMLSKCETSWDKDDLRRQKALSKAFRTDAKEKKKKKGAKKGEDFDQMEEYLKSYIASDSESEDGEAAAEKYRQLLALGDEEKKEDEDDLDSNEEVEGDREISYNPDLNDAVSKSIASKRDQEGKEKKLTPFQEYLERKKQKKREKRAEERMKKRKERGETFSDDELPEGVADDPFFKEVMSKKHADDDESENEEGGSQGDSEDNEEADEEQKSKELELLLMDEHDDGRKHFSLKKIMKNEKGKKGKRKQKDDREPGKESAKDDFKIDLNDPRFSAIFSDHRFNLDPTDASFRKTKAMDTLIKEKTKRRKIEGMSDTPVDEKPIVKKPVSHEATVHVDSLKQKLKNIGKQKSFKPLKGSQ